MILKPGKRSKSALGSHSQAAPDHENDIKRPVVSSVYKAMTYFFLLLTLIYLVYKIEEFTDFQGLVNSWKSISPDRYIWLAVVLLLLPFNWIFEAWKWKSVTRHAEKMSLSHSLKAVLSGASTGFITPNKLGDVWGRMQYLEPKNRTKGWSLFMISSLTQNLAIIVPGIPALVLFSSMHPGTEFHLNSFMLMLYVSLGGLIFLLYMLAPELESLIEWRWLKKYTSIIGEYSKKDLLIIFVKAQLRFLLSCIQFYGMLRFFGLDLTFLTALISIPVHFMLVTLTPSLAFGEALVRSSYAVLIFGTLSGQVVNIAFAGATLWFINIVLPVVLGSVLMIRARSKSGL